MKRLTLIDKAFLLKKTILFGSLDLDLLLAIADKLGVAIYEPGEEIFVVNEEANRMYIIFKGEVIVRSVDCIRLATLRASDFFGDEALFNEKPRAYEAVSKTTAYLLTLSRTNLFAIISECPSVGLGFLQAYMADVKFRSFKSIEGEL